MADPFSALFGVGGGLSAGGGGPSGASGTVNTGFDSSGWAVSFGSGSANATGSAGGMSQYLPYILAGAAVLIVWRMTRKN